MIDLKALRAKKGMTQQQLADEIHCVRTAIANIECGITNPSVEMAKALGKALDFDWWKMFEEGDENALHGSGSGQIPKN